MCDIKVMFGGKSFVSKLEDLTYFRGLTSQNLEYCCLVKSGLGLIR